jgi:hypothetical protein
MTGTPLVPTTETATINFMNVFIVPVFPLGLFRQSNEYF